MALSKCGPISIDARGRKVIVIEKGTARICVNGTDYLVRQCMAALRFLDGETV